MKVNAKKIAGIGLMTAIVVVLQLIGSAIRFGTFSISLVLIPIVIGTALYGKGAGAWLGLVFGAVVLMQPDTALFLNMSVFGTVLTVLQDFCQGLYMNLSAKRTNMQALFVRLLFAR